MAPSKSILIVAQVFISCLMALLMTGIFTAVPMQFASGWVTDWLRRFIVAWPIAFALSLVVAPVSFRLAVAVVRLGERARGRRAL